MTFCGSVYAQGDTESDAQAALVAPEEGLYSYDPNNMPDVFFFPKERAKWDGSRVTVREWYMLTDTQKERFISEYLGELRDERLTGSDAMEMDYLKALNIFSSYSNDRTMREPSTKFIDILLSGQGKMTVKDKPHQ
jgi:hypothetical protein